MSSNEGITEKSQLTEENIRGLLKNPNIETDMLDAFLDDVEDQESFQNPRILASIKEATQNNISVLFVKENWRFIEELAENAAALADNPYTPIYRKEFLPKTAQVAMYQLVMYCGKCIKQAKNNLKPVRFMLTLTI